LDAQIAMAALGQFQSLSLSPGERLLPARIGHSLQFMRTAEFGHYIDIDFLKAP
jgi:hypothetical protein